MKLAQANSPYLKPKVRCAVYTRKSTDEGLAMEYNSLDAQRDAAEAYIRSQLHEGWVLVPERYDDPAYSGGTMDRPALQRLMTDIKAGRVQMVVVYKIDRLSRSLMDFATLARMFEEHGASFASVTEQFSTANAIGRLHLNMILSFAQFERELAGERIRDKFSASKKKGMWMGGYPPLGYDVANRHLLVNPSEAETVRWIFQRFLELRSYRELARELNAAGHLSKLLVTQEGKRRGGNPFTPMAVHAILRNPIYLGKINDHGTLYDGLHEAIISPDVWERVQKSIKASRFKGRTPGKTSSILRGMVHCACCKSSMAHTFTRKKDGRLYRYFTCSTMRRRVDRHCPMPTISADELEKTVLTQLQNILRQPRVITQVWESLQGMGHGFSEEDVRRQLGNMAVVWDELFPLEQRNLIQMLVRRVEMSPQGADIHMHMDRIGELMAENNPREETYDEVNTHAAQPGDPRPHAIPAHQRADHGAGSARGYGQPR